MCSFLRESVLHSRQRSACDGTEKMTWSRIPLVVEKVMLTLDDIEISGEQSDSDRTSGLLREMAWNILDTVDSYAACGALDLSDVSSDAKYGVSRLIFL